MKENQYNLKLSRNSIIVSMYRFYHINLVSLFNQFFVLFPYNRFTKAEVFRSQFQFKIQSKNISFSDETCAIIIFSDCSKIQDVSFFIKKIYAETEIVALINTFALTLLRR